MKIRNLRLALGLAVLLALTLTSLASGHPALYSTQGKIARPPEVQTITIDATGGKFKPSTGAASVAFNAPAYAVQAALGADPAIGRNPAGNANVLVTGAPGGPYTLTFQGSLAGADVPQVVPDPSELTGGASTATPATTTQGGGSNITFITDPTGTTMPSNWQTVIANDGYVTQWTESNGLADHGWLNLRFMPGAYRAVMTSSEWLNYGPAQTGIQTHATCQNVPALATEGAILASQPFFGQNPIGDPFFNYVPWQKAGAGAGDEPEKWIAAVEAAVSVDLETLNTVDEFRAACEALNAGGGVYVPADTQGGNPANAAIADAVAPLNAMIAQLTNRPLRIQLQAKRNTGKVVAMVTGPLSQSTTVTLRIGPALANQLGTARVLDTATMGFGARGAVLVTLRPSARAANAIANRGGFVDVQVRASSGASVKSVAASLRT